MSRDEYKVFREDEYASVGITCLIIWESEVKADPEVIRSRIVSFCCSS